MLKKVFKIIAKSILAFIIFVAIYLAAAFCLSRITVDKEPNNQEEVTIYILTNGVHTDIVMPTRSFLIDWRTKVSCANTQLNDSTAPYLAMGWGDKGFYLQTPNWSDLKASVAFKAAFALSTTAIHATYHAQMIENNSCKKITISNAQYARLIQYVSTSFQVNERGEFINIKTNANYGKTDAFYEANGSYSFLRTCNTWANNALKACGQKACLWTAFDTGIFLKYK